MANKKISELNAATTVTADDLLVIVDAPAGSEETKKITVSNFMTGFHTLNSDVAWTAWTTTITGNGGTAPTYTTKEGRYRVMDKTCFWEILWERASATSATGGFISFTLPVAISGNRTIDAIANYTSIGDGYAVTSGGVNALVQVTANDTTHGVFIYQATVQTALGLLSATDQNGNPSVISAQGYYEID